MPINALTLRRWHSCVGAFIAPSVIFFSLTGAVQIFGLHEAHGSYVPPGVIVRLSRVHKDQVASPPRRHARASDAPAGSRPGRPLAKAPEGPHLNTLLLKVFFLLVALGLTLSTLVGLWIGLRAGGRSKAMWILLLAGALVPVALLLA